MQLLKVEGIELGAEGAQPPPWLTLAKERPFRGMSSIWNAMIEMGADPQEEYQGETAHDVASKNMCPVLF